MKHHQKKNKNKNNQQTKTKKSPTIATPKAKYNPTTSDAMKVTMLEQQNEILQQQIQQMKHNINILLKNKDQDIETIQNLQRNQKKAINENQENLQHTLISLQRVSPKKHYFQ